MFYLKTRTTKTIKYNFNSNMGPVIYFVMRSSIAIVVATKMPFSEENFCLSLLKFLRLRKKVADISLWLCM